MCPLIWYLKVVKVSVVSDSLQPQGPQPTRLLFPWNFPGKDRKPTGVGCHILLQVIFSTQGPTLVLVYCRLIDSLLFEPPGRPTNLTLNIHKQVWFAPEFHLLIICPEVKLDGLRALVWKFALASLSVLVCYCTWPRKPCWRASGWLTWAVWAPSVVQKLNCISWLSNFVNSSDFAAEKCHSNDISTVPGGKH